MHEDFIMPSRGVAIFSQPRNLGFIFDSDMSFSD